MHACRSTLEDPTQRTRANGTELSAFSPTGADNFHDVAKFAHFYDGNSYQFEAGEPEQGFYTTYRAAADHAARGKPAEALPAFIAAAGAKANDFQKSAALEQAAASARLLQKPDTAAELAARIPVETVRKTAQMQNLIAQRKAAQVIEQFGREDIQVWPFWTAGEAFAVRGRAHADTGDGKNAEADLIRALDFMTDGRTRGEVWLAIADNRAKNLQQRAQALAAYQHVLTATSPSNSATYLRATQRTAEMLNEEGNYAEAEATLRRINFDGLSGVWRSSTLLLLADTLKAAGRKEEALTTYRTVLSDAATLAHHRKAAQEAIEALK